ncbi:MAG: glycerate kinase, partial [Christensenellales bacterium]
MNILDDAQLIIKEAIDRAMPDNAVKAALGSVSLPHKVRLVAIGKAGYQMARAAYDHLGSRIEKGVIITKYGHSAGSFSEDIAIYEAGHPVPDGSSVRGAEAALSLAHSLTPKDTLIFLVSGGGSALFESPLVSLEELQDVNRQLLASGADITEMNTIRKRLSAVKGGRFAMACSGARIIAIILSDIIGDPLDMIASGPACPDSSTNADAHAIISKYGLKLSDKALSLMDVETPKELNNVETIVTGSVTQLCASASETARRLGYRPVVLTASLCCEAKEAGSFLASVAQYHRGAGEPLAFIAGGETVVRITGKGSGGRNQELALSGAMGIAGMKD